MARDDDDDDTMDDLDDNDSPGGSGDEDEDEYTPPSKEEWEKTQQALTKANGEAKKYRLRLKTEREKAGQSAASDAATGGASPAEVEKARKEAEREVMAKADSRIIKSEAKSALVAAGLVDTSPDAVKRVVRMLDMDDLSVDDDGEVEGLDDAVRSLMSTTPALFRTKKTVAKTGGGTGTRKDGAGAGTAKKSSASRLAAALKG